MGEVMSSIFSMNCVPTISRKLDMSYNIDIINLFTGIKRDLSPLKLASRGKVEICKIDFRLIRFRFESPSKVSK